MGKLIAIVLLTSLSLTLSGYHIVFCFQLASIKKEVRGFLKNQKNHKDVLQLSFSVEEAKHLDFENENEFLYNGEMYDVVEKKIKDNILIIRCIEDKKETALLNEYQKNNKRNSSNSGIVQLVTAPFILPVDHSLLLPERIVKNHFRHHSSSLQNIASAVLAPPPDVC